MDARVAGCTTHLQVAVMAIVAAQREHTSACKGQKPCLCFFQHERASLTCRTAAAEDEHHCLACNHLHHDRERLMLLHMWSVHMASMQSSPVLRSAGECFEQQEQLTASLPCFLLKALLPKCTAAVACSSSKDFTVVALRFAKRSSCLLSVAGMQDSYPLRAAPAC